MNIEFSVFTLVMLLFLVRGSNRMSNSTLVLQEKKLFLLEGGWPITFTSDQSLSVIFLTYFCLIRQYIKMKKSNYE